MHFLRETEHYIFEDNMQIYVTGLGGKNNETLKKEPLINYM
jgi:hypothetical protein